MEIKEKIKAIINTHENSTNTLHIFFTYSASIIFSDFTEGNILGYTKIQKIQNIFSQSVSEVTAVQSD